MMPQPAGLHLPDIPFSSGTASKLRPVLLLWITKPNDRGEAFDFMS
jgi:hypothetical protein